MAEVDELTKKKIEFLQSQIELIQAQTELAKARTIANKEYLSLEEAYDYSSTKEKTFKTILQAGLKTIKFERKVIVQKSDLDQVLEGLKV